MTTRPKLMRDAFIDELYARAQQDKDIVFISADFGAAALDRFREDLPNQFVHSGICEQHMVDFGSGLALSGKKVFLYAMAPFITLRCIEQVKCTIAAMGLPVTLIAVGVGLGYDHATLTHFTPEDIACLRSMNGIEVLSPADAVGSAALAHMCVDDPAFRYIRLERQGQPNLYTEDSFKAALPHGLATVKAGADVALVACGAMTHSALKAAEILATQGISAGVIDLFRIKGLNAAALAKTLAPYKAMVTVEEQMLEGGFSAAVIEALLDQSALKPTKRVGLKDGFEVVNGHREHLHQLYGIDVPSIVAAAQTALA
jgi:transketolase